MSLRSKPLDISVEAGITNAPVAAGSARQPPHHTQNRRALPSQIAQKRRDPGALGLGTAAQVGLALTAFDYAVFQLAAKREAGDNREG